MIGLPAESVMGSDRNAHLEALRRRPEEVGSLRISLHGLRHTFASIALIEGRQPVSVVSQRLGHVNLGITLDFYSHAMPRHDDETTMRPPQRWPR